MEKSAKNKFSKIFEKFESEVKRNKSQTVEPIVEEVEEEVQLSEKEERGLDLFSSLMESLSDDNKETEESEIQDDPTDDVTSDVGEWIKKDIDKNDKKVEALGELFAPLLPEEENIEPVIEELEIPDELLKEFQEKPVQPKKPRPIKKAMISVEEQKYMSNFLDEIAKLPPEETPVDMSEQSFPNSIKDSLLTPDQTSLQRKVAQPEDSLTRLRKEFEQFRTVMQRNLEAKQNAYDGNSGSGAVKIQDMDDVDADGALINGNVFRFNSSKGKFDSVAPVTEALIQEGTDDDKILLDGTDSSGSDSGNFITLEDASVGSAVDLTAVAQDIIPDQGNLRNLGSSSRRFKELFLAGSTIDLGGATISSDGTGTVSISSDGVTLPSNSKVGSDTIAKAGTNGKTSIDVEFFSRAGGTSTANATFKFQSKGLSYVFTDGGSFTLSDGTALEDQNPELFTF